MVKSVIKAIMFTIGLVIAGSACGQALQGVSPIPTATMAASSEVATKTAITQVTPLATARAFRVAEPIAFQDGWRLTVLRLETQVAAGCTAPGVGNRYFVVVTRFDNGSRTPLMFNLYDFRLQDSTGVRRAPTLGGCRDDRLDVFGEVGPAAFVTGAVVFEIPSSASQLQLIYQSTRYPPTTVDLS